MTRTLPTFARHPGLDQQSIPRPLAASPAGAWTLKRVQGDGAHSNKKFLEDMNGFWF